MSLNTSIAAILFLMLFSDLWPVIIESCSFEALLTLRIVCKKFLEIIKQKRTIITNNLHSKFHKALEYGDVREAKAIRIYSYNGGFCVPIAKDCLIYAGISGSEECINYIIDSVKNNPLRYNVIDTVYGMVIGGHIDLAIKYRNHLDYTECVTKGTITGAYRMEYWYILRLCIINCYTYLFQLMRPKDNYYYKSIILLPVSLDKSPDPEKSVDFIVEHVLIPLKKVTIIDYRVYMDSDEFMNKLIDLGNARLIREAVDLKLGIYDSHIIYAEKKGFIEIAQIIRTRNSRTSRKRRARKAKKQPNSHI